MASLPVDEWDPSLFDDLEQLLVRVAAQPTTSTVRRLYIQLEHALPWLLALTQLPAPSDSEKASLDKNPIALPSGTVVQITGDLLSTASAIAPLLSVSYRLAAILVLRAQEQSSRYPSRSIPEIAAYLLHAWTARMLSFLEQLLGLTVGPQAEEGQPFDGLRDKVTEILQRRVAVGSGEGTLVDLILNQIDELQNKLDGLVRTQRVLGPEYDLLVFRAQSVRADQSRLVGILSLIAQGGRIGRGHVIKLLKWLKKADRIDGLVGSVLASFFAISRPLDSLDTEDPRYETADEWCRDIKFLKIASNLILVEAWAVPRLKESVKLSWSLFILSTLRHDPTSAQVGIDPPTADQYLLDAVTGEAFQFLRDLAFSIRQERGQELKDEQREAAEDVLVKLASVTEPNNDPFIFSQLQAVINSVAAKKHFLRNLRNREEDTAIRRSAVGPPAANFQAFLSFVAVVYRSLPEDSAEDLWDDVAFTTAVFDTRGYPGPAGWEALQAISTGPICAAKSYEKIKETKIQWLNLFAFYQHYYALMPHLYESIKSNKVPQNEPMTQEDVQLGVGWTKLLSTVVKHSPVARSALLQAKPHPLQSLFDFINCEVPVELKVAVFDAITAFCSPNAGAVDDDVLTRAVEHYERVTYADIKFDPRTTDKMPPPVGWLQRLNYTEADISAYPLTRAYLRFLTALLAGSQTNSRLVLALRRCVHYVFDHILLTLDNRRYARESEQWEILDEIFAFVQTALFRFNMADLSTLNNRNINAVAWGLFDQPGFVVLLKLLSDSRVFSILAKVLDTAAPVPRTTIANKVLLSILRIYHRVLDIQLVFSDVLLLTLVNHSLHNPFHFRRPVDLQSLDFLLLNHLPNVIAIAQLVGDLDLSVSLVSTKIVATLAASPLFNQADRFRGEYSRSVNRLAGVIDASDESIRIAQAFCTRLDGDGVDLAPEDIEKVERAVLEGDASKADIGSLPLVIRSNIVDILVEGTDSDAAGPNIAHFLLGFEFKGHEFTLQDPNSADSRYSCLQVVLQQLRGDDDVDADERRLNELSLVAIHPVIAAKTARLVHQLFSHPITGPATMAYATSIEGFSASQLAALPVYCPQTTGRGQGVVTYHSGELSTTASTLVAFLDLQRWVVSCVALETHAYEGRGASSETIAAELFSGDAEEAIPPMITDLLHNIDLSWREEIGEDRPIEFYAGFDFDQFKRPDVDWWDVDALHRALRAFRRQLERQGAISNGKAMDAEADYLVHRLAIRNRETEINVAKGAFLTAWAEVLKVALGQLFIPYVPEERQEAVSFELLDALLGRVVGDVSPGVLDILSESILVTTSTLVSILSEYDGINLPVEQLAAIFNMLINVVIRPGTTENARGNVYAAITQFLTLLAVPSVIPDDVTLGASTIGRPDIPGTTLQRATIAVLNAKKDRFFAVLSRDAMDVRDVWKTECFALLGGLVGSCTSERDRQVLSPLLKDGYLHLFVRSIKDREMALQECLSPGAETLHAYWVFEAKITFLMAVAATRKGAEDLLDAGVFEIFSMCSFVSVQPYVDEDEAATDAVSRQHHVLVCILQLLSRTLASLHKSSRSGAGHALSFLNSHRDSIILLLRELPQAPSVTGIEECRLLIAILAMVIHKVPEEDRRSTSGFGAFHLSILAVAATFFDGAWVDALEEEEKIKIAGPVLELNQVVLGYLCAATPGLKAGGGYPVFVNGSHRTNGGQKYIATAPSLQMVVDMLSDLVEDVQDLAAEYDALVERLEDGGDLSASDIARLESFAVTEFSPESVRPAYASRSQLLFNMIESLLLLAWRHLLYFANDARGDTVRPDNLSFSLAGSQLETSRVGVGAVRALEKIAAGLRGVLERLGDVSVSPDLKRNGEKGDAYFGMLIRRLGELTAGLSGEA